MKKRYEEVMEQLTVTEKMRERILKNVAEEMTDVSSAAPESASNDPFSPTPKKKSTTRIAHFHALQGVLAAAACAALVFLMRGLLVQRRPVYADQGSVMSETAAGTEETAAAAETLEQNAVPASENSGQEAARASENAEPGAAEASGRSAASPKEKQAAEESAVSIANGMEDVSSAEALSQVVGFAVPDIAGDLTEVLSFTGEETVYTSYWGEMAQITYRGTISDDASDDSEKASRKAPSEEVTADSETADDASGDAAADRGSVEASDEFCFRISEGTEDNSGDYNTYADVRTISVGTIKVTLKGDAEDADVLAIWSADGYSYSLSAPCGLSDSEWESLIARISEEKNGLSSS